MNTLVLACLLCFAFSAVGVLGSEVTFSNGLSRVTGGPASGEGLQSSLSDDEELEVDDDLSGGADISSSHGTHHRGDERISKKKKKGKGKRRHRLGSQATTAFNPEHTYYTGGHTVSGHTAGLTSVHSTTTEDPCGTTHLSYCIHGFCKYMEGLQEPVCVCMKGYDGERCGIQLLESRETKNDEEEGGGSEVVQTILVVIAVVLSIISCTAILLMTCAHYRTHKNFMAAYLGTGTEEEKLQKAVNDVMV